jgi:hypothetical protein
MIESKPLPKSAMTALRLAHASFQRVVNDVGADAITDLGLSATDGWSANFDTGMAERTVPEKAE